MCGAADRAQCHGAGVSVQSGPTVAVQRPAQANERPPRDNADGRGVLSEVVSQSVSPRPLRDGCWADALAPVSSVQGATGGPLCRHQVPSGGLSDGDGLPSTLGPI